MRSSRSAIKSNETAGGTARSAIVSRAYVLSLLCLVAKPHRRSSQWRLSHGGFRSRCVCPHCRTSDDANEVTHEITRASLAARPSGKRYTLAVFNRTEFDAPRANVGRL